MKKALIFVLFILLLVPIANALFDNNLITGMASFNEPPETISGQPSSGTVAHKMHFTWMYKDKEGDEQEAYLLQIDRDFRFFSGINVWGIKGTSKEVKLEFESGKYCWRIKSKDAYGWGDWSDHKCFVLDTSKKTCNDGTAYWECSGNIPLYCDGGNLIEDCQRCGCDVNEACRPSGICIKKTCIEGTSYGECSSRRPSYCQAGNLIKLCSLCGCPSGKVCQPDGTCSIGIVVVKQRGEGEQRTLLEIVAEFFKGLFEKVKI